jgi:hypothetical protein
MVEKMNAASFAELYDTFDPTDQQQAKQIQGLIEDYPYFQTLLLLSAKAEVAQEKLTAEKALQKAAIATSDRGLLKAFMESPVKVQKKKTPKKSTSKTTQKEAVAPSPPPQKKTQPTTFSFTEWVNRLETHSPQASHTNASDKWDLIDAFIEKNPSIGPISKTSSYQDPLEGNEIPQSELMTETLARVFVKQEKYEEALKAYTILSLKYPEKNSFFADQIKAIKRLQRKKDK